jgi:hypothetical protein
MCSDAAAAHTVRKYTTGVAVMHENEMISCGWNRSMIKSPDPRMYIRHGHRSCHNLHLVTTPLTGGFTASPALGRYRTCQSIEISCGRPGEIHPAASAPMCVTRTVEPTRATGVSTSTVVLVVVNDQDSLCGCPTAGR